MAQWQEKQVIMSCRLFGAYPFGYAPFQLKFDNRKDDKGVEINMYRRYKVAKWAAITLAIIVVIGICLSVVSALSQDTKEIRPSFTRGSLNEQGKVLESNTELVTKKYFKCRGLTITLDEDSDVTYQVFYFDKHEEFISSSEIITGDYDGEGMPENAVYARLVVMPDIDEDETLSWFGNFKYINQLTITVSRDQTIKKSSVE